MKKETEEYISLMHSIDASLEKINKLSESDKIKDCSEYEFAHKVAHLIDDLEAQVRIMNLVYKNWYHTKEKKGEIKE